VASLWTREANTHRDADEAKEELGPLAERLRKEWDKLLQTIARLWQEHDDAHHKINYVLGEV
jgi:phytoene dehydrogenase-like protein